MTVQQLIAELQKLPADMPVFVAESPGHNYAALEYVVPHEHTDADYVLLAGEFDE